MPFTLTSLKPYFTEHFIICNCNVKLANFHLGPNEQVCAFVKGICDVSGMTIAEGGMGCWQQDIPNSRGPRPRPLESAATAVPAIQDIPTSCRKGACAKQQVQTQRLLP